MNILLLMLTLAGCKLELIDSENTPFQLSKYIECYGTENCFYEFVFKKEDNQNKLEKKLWCFICVPEKKLIRTSLWNGGCVLKNDVLWCEPAKIITPHDGIQWYLN